MTVPDPSQLRLSQQFNKLDNLHQGGAACPPAEDIWDAACGRISGRKARKIVDHTIVCGTCSEAWSLAREASAGQAGGELRSFPIFGRKLLIYTPIAAAAILILFLALPSNQQLEPDVVTRGGETPVLTATQPQGPSLLRSDCRLKWQLSPSQAGVHYRVRVTTGDLFEVVAEARDLDEAEYKIPQNLLDHLAPGTQLVWMIKAVTEEGQEYSQTFTYQLE